MLDEIRHHDCVPTEIAISSVSGNKDTGLSIASLIYQEETNLIIKEFCFSSCSEFLMTGAADITFKERPLIGFHRNAPMKEWLARHLEVPNLEFCQFDDVDKMYELYFNRDLNFNFWRRQLDVLKLDAFAVDPEIATETCPKMAFNFQHEMWFPNSETLRNELGLKFKGRVCADDVQYCAIRVREIFPNLGTFVVGDIIVDTDIISD